MSYGRWIGIEDIFCFLLFAAPFVEHIIPGGDLYLACVAGMTAFAGISREAGRREKVLAISHADLFFMACLLYMAARMPRPVDMGLCVKLLSVSGIWFYVRLNATAGFQRKVAGWMMVAGSGQAFTGLLQGLGVLESFHSGFAVTGTFGNPGPFGGYLAMVAALLLPCLLQGGQSSLRRGCLCAGFVLMVAALALSDSRAAWCAVGVAVLLFLYMEWPWRKRAMKKAVAVLLAIALPIAAMSLYSYRPGSADARLLIWAVCGQLISQSPLWGVGTGQLAACYMPMQAQYLLAAPEAIRRNADDNLFAYNEVLTVLCEQGMVGLLFILSLLALVIRGFGNSSLPSGNAVFLFPLVAFLVFSQFSYPLSLWSFVCLLPLMAALGVGQGHPVCGKRAACRPAKWRGLPSILACVLLGCGLVCRCRAQAWVKSYSVLAAPSDAPSGVVDWTIRHDPFLLAYGTDAALLRGDDERALDYMAGLGHYVRSARWSIKRGDAYAETGDTLQALRCYRQASRMMPGLLYPLYAEFGLCRAGNKERAALSLARKIEAFVPKVENRKTRWMKDKARRYVRSRSK